MWWEMRMRGESHLSQRIRTSFRLCPLLAYPRNAVAPNFFTSYFVPRT